MGSAFEAVVGAAHVCAPARPDLDGVPIAEVVRPGNAGEVAACLALAADAGIALVPSGGGSKRGWGNRSCADSLVQLDLGRLSSPPAVDPDEGIATAAAGLPLEVLEARARELGKTTWLPSVHRGATLGGSVAADPLGPELSLDRRLRNELLGLEVALPNGTLTRCGGRVVKNVTGFDLVRLYCGSLGTLGVITEVTLRLRPVPEQSRVLERVFPSVETALPLAVELALEGGAVGAGLLAADGELRLLWRCEGREAELAERERRVPGSAVDEAEWAALGAVLAEGAEPWLGPGPARLRVAGRPSDTLPIWSALAARGHVCTPRLALPLVGVVYADVEELALPTIVAALADLGYALQVERCSPELKQTLDVFGPAPAVEALLRAVKGRFDPRGILSPGRFVARI